MEKNDRVSHKKIGGKGTVKNVFGEYSFVLWDGSSIAIPYKSEWLEKIKEGDHGQSNSDQFVDGL